MRGATLAVARLMGVDFRGGALMQASDDGVGFGAADSSGKKPKANTSGADLTEANLRGSNLTGSNMNGVNLSGANLSRANLTKVSLRKANLAGADFKGACLRGVDMSLALIDGADFQGADLKGAILEDVDMESANFAGAELFVDISSFGDTVATILQEHEKWIKTDRSEENTSELQSLMRISYAVFCLK